MTAGKSSKNHSPFGASKTGMKRSTGTIFFLACLRRVIRIPASTASGVVSSVNDFLSLFFWQTQTFRALGTAGRDDRDPLEHLLLRLLDYTRIERFRDAIQ